MTERRASDTAQPSGAASEPAPGNAIIAAVAPEPKTAPAAETPPPEPAPPSLRESWVLLKPFLVGSWGRLVALSISSVVAGVMEAGILVLLVQIGVAISAEAEDIDIDIPGGVLHLTIPQLFWLALLLAVVTLLLQFVLAWMPARISTKAQLGLQIELFGEFVGADWPHKASQQDGYLLSLLGAYIGRTANAVLQAASGLAAMFSFLALLVTALVVNATAAIAIVTAVALLFFLLRPLSRISRKYTAQSADASLVYSQYISESVRMAEEMQVFDVGEGMRSRLNGAAHAVEEPAFRARFVGLLVPGLYRGTALILVVVALGLVYAIGGSRLSTLGAIVLILIRAMGYAQNVQGSYHKLNDLIPILERVDEASTAYRKHAQVREGLQLPRIETLGFDAVGYEYSPGVRVLSDVSFEVAAGESVGIVGPSGAGKSTLVQILLRLREPTTGRYLVNGRAAHEYSLEDWFDRIAFVSQDTRLYRASVADNIRFFRPDITQEQIEEAARKAHIHDEILRLADGYDTLVDQRAAAVSGGQRQRLCIARALVAEPDVIILDEPTSALDPQSEKGIKETLDGLHGSVTLFIVAHRMSTLQDCDRIMVLEDGRLKAFDSRVTLEQTSTFYREALQVAGIT